MQTFLPFMSFIRSAEVLDNKRLNKQITEAMQILDTLKLIDQEGRSKTNNIKGWMHHPAVLQWIGYEKALSYYVKVCIKEWVKRGKNNNRKVPKISLSEIQKPDWLTPTICRSHRSMLLQKDREFYSQQWSEPLRHYYWPYVWSPKHNKRIYIKESVYHKISRGDKMSYDKELAHLKMS